ncbi:synaptotagmin-1-like [Asterias rubens]|uniref:synaptotagmin-1-like n=1 Tax=Asterias rubens TaxID=7604 RepID=UPI001455A4ED|nr:synaptotagmin-1-like [Asterias rubens]XP_033643818.1 synaptotagmin-1-like [Asterias rubens]
MSLKIDPLSAKPAQEQLLQKPTVEPTQAEPYASIPYPIPLVIGLLVGAQVIIIMSVLIYIFTRSNKTDEPSSRYGEIGWSPPHSGSSLWGRLRMKVRFHSQTRKMSSKYIPETNFIEKWRSRKRDNVAAHPRTTSAPIEFTIPTRPETPFRAKANEKVRPYPLTPMAKPSLEPWITPRRRRPFLTMAKRTRSLQQTELDKPQCRMSRSNSMPNSLAQAAAAMEARRIKQSTPCDTTIGQIEPDLYRIDEQNEVYTPSKFGLGKLSFSLFFDSHEGQLTVYLIQAVQLPARTERATADTFVEVSLLPEEERRSATSKVQRRTLNPIYRQNFIFRLPEDEVVHTVVKFTVIGLDRYSHPVHIGQVVHRLSDRDFCLSASDVSVPIWRDIEQSDLPEEPKQGDLLFSLTYLPNAERVTVTILKARNLLLPDSEDPDARKLVMDTFVKVSVVKGGKVVRNKQTSVVRRNANPSYNEAFTIDLRCEDEKVCIVFAVCLRVNPFAGHKTLGRCLVGPGKMASADGAAHWRDMMVSPRNAMTAWHPLK